MARRVAITGLGAITPVGNDPEGTWQALVAGRSGIGRITVFDPEKFPVRIAGLVKDFDVARYVPDRALRRRLSRVAGFAVAAMLQALHDAKIAPETYEPHEKGISMGGSVGRPELDELAEMVYQRQLEGGKLYRQGPASMVRRDQTVPVAVMAMLAQCMGPMINVSTACSGSTHGVGEAFRRIQDGEAKMMVAGGADSLTTYLDVIGFSLLGALTKEYNDDPTRASRPFERDRSGFVLGEGAVVCVLEEWDAAKARGAKIYAELAGYGSSLNAYRITDAPPDGTGPILAMRNALQESGMRPEQVDYVVAHGTSTPGNDVCETAAIKAVFGDHAYKLAVSSPKSMTGHLTSGAGGLNLLAAIMAMRDSVVSPTINQEHPDPKLDLNYVPNEAQRRPVRGALVDAFAFGGTNAVLAVRHPDFAGGR